MRVPLTLSYDRHPNDSDPLSKIIQIIWNNGIDEINRFAASTLEFYIEESNHEEIGKKINILVSQLEKVAQIRLSATYFVRGDGNKNLNVTLVEFMSNQLNAGILKQSKDARG